MPAALTAATIKAAIRDSRAGFGPFEQRRPGFTLSRRSKGQIPGIRPLGRSEVAASKRSSTVQAFSETRSAYYALC